MDSEDNGAIASPIRSFRDLRVYQLAVDSAMRIFRLSASFPRSEAYSLTDQIRRSSRSVAANFAEAWRKRRYPAAFVSRLSDAETEATETQVWLEFAVKCGYLSRDDAVELYKSYDRLQRTIVGMIRHADKWTIRQPKSKSE